MNDLLRAICIAGLIAAILGGFAWGGVQTMPYYERAPRPRFSGRYQTKVTTKARPRCRCAVYDYEHEVDGCPATTSMPA